MAEKKKTVSKAGLIDPVYEKYMNRVIMMLKSDEFYQYFMESILQGERSYQFSNRKLEKRIDATWIEAIEKCIEPFHNIIMNPRNFIIEKEEIVNVAVARQSTPEVLRHLTTHGKYIDEITEDNVRPNHLLNKFKEDSWNTYENRFVYTLLEKTTDFVSRRFEAIFANMGGEEYGAFLKVESNTKNDTDTVSTKLDIRIRQNEDYLNDDKESMDLFARLTRLNERLKEFNASQFAREMSKYVRVKNPIVKTNAIRKNPNFKACYELWVFLYNYHDVGYEIKVYEQSNEIKPEFEQDIYNSIFVNYLILKHYLDREEDRLIDTNRRFKKRTLKPRYIKKIVEEIVGNYDVTGVEVRKIFIEEFTRAQLEQLEEKERRKLVEDRERRMAKKRMKEAEKKKKIQQEQQMERAKRIRQKEEEKERLRQLEEKRQQERQNLVESCMEELKRFETDRKNVLDKRERAKQQELEREQKKQEKARKEKARKVQKPEAEAQTIKKEPENSLEEKLMQAVLEEEHLPEPISKEPIPKEPIPKEPISKEPIPEEAISKEPIPEEAISKEPIPEEAISKEPISKEQISEEHTSGGIPGAFRNIFKKMRGE